jgi:hypothetical protein
LKDSLTAPDSLDVTVNFKIEFLYSELFDEEELRYQRSRTVLMKTTPLSALNPTPSKRWKLLVDMLIALLSS